MIAVQTNIFDQLDLDEETQEALRREAVRRQEPISVIAKEWLLEVARGINGPRPQRGGESHRQQQRHVA